jgi:murein L,D-transpeptidase YcbB/YkuD
MALEQPWRQLSRGLPSSYAAYDSGPFQMAYGMTTPVVDPFQGDYRDLVWAAYAERQFQPVFVQDCGLTPAGQAVLVALDDAFAHGLDPGRYGAHRAEQRLRVLHASDPSRLALALTAEEREALVDWLARQPDLLVLDPSAVGGALLDRVLSVGAPAIGPTQALARAYRQALEAAQACTPASVELELMLAAGFLRYAHEMRFFNPLWFEPQLEDEPDPALAQSVIDSLLSVFRAGAADEGFPSVLARLPPAYPEYSLLLEAHRRYRQIVDGGGWEAIDLPLLEPGQQDDGVPALRRRLHAEGYLDGDLTSDVFDGAVQSALESYERNHQLEADGRLDEGVLDSLNVPALRRAQQMAVTLQRWRESGIGTSTYYLLLNIPELYAEFWRDGHRDLRFRVVVGISRRFRREGTDEMVWPHATPLLHSLMTRVLFNPSWHVPHSIQTWEYDPHLLDNPSWYEDNGFHVTTLPNGSRLVRQPPGPGNPLGRVKFDFDNRFGVYLHDTNRRELFEEDVRDFSHGCMRAQNALDLADYILSHDQEWSRERTDEMVATWRTRSVELLHPVPVNVEYYVVRFDDEGRVAFFDDLYGYDQPRLSAQAELERGMATTEAGWLVREAVDAAATGQAWPATP